MHKVLKYIYESSNVFVNIIGILGIAMVMYFITNAFLNTYTMTPKTIQAVVVAKDIVESNKPFVDNTYKVIIKTDSDKLAEYNIEEKEFNRLENNKQYILQVKKKNILYAVVSTQDKFLEKNKITAVEINVSENEIQTAKSLGYNVDETIVAVEPKDETPIEEPIETPIEEPTETPVEEPIVEEPIEDNEPVEEPSIKEEALIKKFLSTRENSVMTNTITSLNKEPFTISITFENDSTTYSCDTLPAEKGKCTIEEGKTILVINNLNAKLFVIVNIYSDEITDASAINFTTEYKDN